MPPRTLETATFNTLDDEVIYPAWFLRLDIASDPVYVWTGLGPLTGASTGDANFDGVTFLGLANLGEIEEVTETKEGSQTLKLSLPGVDINDVALKPIVNDVRSFQFRRGFLWLAMLNGSNAIVGKPVRVKTGRMDKINISRDIATGKVSVFLESFAAYAGEALNTRYSEQKEIDSTDISQDFVHDLANKSANVGGKKNDVKGSGSNSDNAGRTISGGTVSRGGRVSTR